MSTCARGIYLQCVVEEPNSITIGVLRSEELPTAKLCFEVCRICFNGRTINVIRILKPFQMHECARNWSKFLSGLWSIVGVVPDQSLVNCLCPLFLTNCFQRFTLSQLAVPQGSSRRVNF